MVEEEKGNHHTELAAELSAVDTEQIILGPEVVEKELSETHRAASAAINSNINNDIIGVPTMVDEAPELVIYE